MTDEELQLIEKGTPSTPWSELLAASAIALGVFSLIVVILVGVFS